MSREHYSSKFDWFTNMAVSMLSISLAVYAIYIAGGSPAMTQPLPTAVILFLVLAGIGFLLALYNGIRTRTTPKDTRLDDLITAVKSLKSNNTSITKTEQDEIRLIAHSIWEIEGKPNGHETDNWQKAKEIWEALQKQKQSR